MLFLHFLRRLDTVRIGLILCMLIFLAGCPWSKNNKSVETKLPLDGLKLRLLVVDDAALAEAVRKVEGEWHTQTGATLEVAETTESAFLAQEVSLANAAICPSYLLGVLAEQQRLTEIPEALRDDGEENWTEIFELVRHHETSWGTSTLAVPFGSPVFVCYYRTDLLKALGKEPPRTWTEYQELAKLLDHRAKLGEKAPPTDAVWSGTMEPLGPGWGGLVLLARASSGVTHPDNFSTWFDIETMEPLVESPPVVHALEQLVEAAEYGPADQLLADPTEVRTAFWQGACGMALSWPTADSSLGKEKIAPLLAGVAELPGSREHYNVDERRLEERDNDVEWSVPLLATSGRIGVIFKGSERPDAAAELLLWLSALRADPPPASRSPWTTMFRRSQLSRPGNWVEAPMSPATAAGYAKQTKATFGREQWTFALRIPGRREYLRALDEAVAAAVRGEKTPALALHEAAGQWRAITKQLGVQRQRVAYLHSLGLEP
ncbi:MAG: extracellular solute-binding protein [Pirellulales bacterium]|nr:extracellular solute-binding protein [Pirellulales bacterium]